MDKYPTRNQRKNTPIPQWHVYSVVNRDTHYHYSITRARRYYAALWADLQRHGITIKPRVVKLYNTSHKHVATLQPVIDGYGITAIVKLI
jgi:hypothetical protein